MPGRGVSRATTGPDRPAPLSAALRRLSRRSIVYAALLLGSAATSHAQTVAVPDGYATQNGGTTGGGNATAVTVSTAAAFRSAVSGTAAAKIIVNGKLNVGDVSIGSNKTIIGANNTSGLYGGRVNLDGTNYILQNLIIGPAPIDALEVSGGRNIFITKCEFYGSTDELCSIVRQADFVTVSWCKFYFPTPDSHSFAHLIGNGDDVTADRGKLHVTMHHNWYAPGVEGRMPRVRFGHVHLYNNYYNAVGNGYCIGIGVECNIRLENSVFESVSAPWADYGGTGNGRIGWANLQFINATQPSFMPNTFPVFTPPYAFTLDPVGSVKGIVTAGAGNKPVTPPPAPGIPGGLSATAGNAQISLSWNSSSGASSYNVKRSTTSGGPYTTVASPTTTSYTNTGLSNGTTYYYVVSAVNTGGESGNSTQTSATPNASLVVPLQIEASSFGGGVTIDSDNAGFNGTGFANFPTTGGFAQFNNVSGGTGGAATVAVRYALGITTSRTAQLLVNGVAQNITFAPSGGWATWVTVSVNVTLNSGTGNTLRFQSNGQDTGNIDQITVTPTTVVTAPSAPAGLSATPGNAQVSLSWTASSGATSYNIKRATTSGGPYTTAASPTTTSHVDTGLTNGTTYYYVVSAVNSAGESGNSSQASATPVAPQPPAAPSNLTATTSSSSQINLAWTDNATNETGFTVDRATDAAFSAGLVSSNLGANVNSFSATGLSAGTTYFFRVRASGSAGSSGNSNTASATTSAAPPPVTLQAENGVIAGSVSIDSDNAGFNGTGFLNFPTTGGSVQFNNVDGGTGGSRTVVVRYALGVTTARTAQLLINGVAQNITFAPSGGWAVWVTVSANITLNSGTGNTIRIQTNGQDAGNVDQITVSAP